MRKAKSEARRVGGTRKDPFDNVRDLQKKYNSESKVPGRKGYIKDLCSDPLRVLMYHDASFEVLDLILEHHMKNNSDLCFSVDATGMSLAREKTPTKEKITLYYAVVVKSPVAKEPPLALVELLTNDHRPSGISSIFKFFAE